MEVSKEAHALMDLLNSVPPYPHGWCNMAKEFVQQALDAAENRGRKQHHAMNPALEHAGLVCEGCSVLVEKGREEKRVEVLEKLSNAYRFRVEAQPATGGVSAITILESDILSCLQPPKPAVPPAPEWFKEWRHSDCDGTLSEQWAAYLKHASKVDAGELAKAAADAVWERLWRGGYQTKAGFVADIRAVLERGE